jgi:hypothetical protein
MFRKSKEDKQRSDVTEGIAVPRLDLMAAAYASGLRIRT